MNPVSSALARLNLETRAHHAPADAPWRALCQGGTTVEDYIAQLISTYGFEASIEAALAYTPGLRERIDLRARARAGLLARDLLTLGLTPHAVARLPQCFPLALFASPIEALGWLYVLERATLIHAGVRRHLATYMPQVRHALDYLDAYRGIVGARWGDFGLALDRNVRSDRDRDTLVAAAHDAFRCLLDWQQGHRAELAQGA